MYGGDWEREKKETKRKGGGGSKGKEIKAEAKEKLCLHLLPKF